MNKNLKNKKIYKNQSPLPMKSLIESKSKKNKLSKSTNKVKSVDIKKNKSQKKQRLKPYNKDEKMNSNNKVKKDNIKVYSKAKPKQRDNNKNVIKVACSNNEKNEGTNKDISLKIHIENNNDNIKIVPKKKKSLQENITNLEKPSSFPLNGVSSIFTAWQNNSILYKIFEEKLLKKSDFEINSKTLEIKTKNAEACLKLQDQKFWILYIEYLINNSLLNNEKQLLSVINEAFSYLSNSDCAQLRTYYLQKIKKYSPCFLIDGSFDDSDDVYFNKLNKSAANFIKNQKVSSNIKLNSISKRKKFIVSGDDELILKDLNENNNLEDFSKNNEIINKDINVREEKEF